MTKLYECTSNNHQVPFQWTIPDHYTGALLEAARTCPCGSKAEPVGKSTSEDDSLKSGFMADRLDEGLRFDFNSQQKCG